MSTLVRSMSVVVCVLVASAIVDAQCTLCNTDCMCFMHKYEGGCRTYNPGGSGTNTNADEIRHCSSPNSTSLLLVSATNVYVAQECSRACWMSGTTKTSASSVQEVSDFGLQVDQYTCTSGSSGGGP